MEDEHAIYVGFVIASGGALVLALAAVAAAIAGARWADLVRHGSVALSVTVLAGAWETAVQFWAISQFGFMENDGMGPGTLYWPMIVVAAAVILFAGAFMRGAARILASAGGGVAIAILLFETAWNATGALRDGSVSAIGWLVAGLSVAQLALLGLALVRVIGRPGSRPSRNETRRRLPGRVGRSA